MLCKDKIYNLFLPLLSYANKIVKLLLPKSASTTPNTNTGCVPGFNDSLQLTTRFHPGLALPTKAPSIAPTFTTTTSTASPLATGKAEPFFENRIIGCDWECPEMAPTSGGCKGEVHCEYGEDCFCGNLKKICWIILYLVYDYSLMWRKMCSMELELRSWSNTL